MQIIWHCEQDCYRGPSERVLAADSHVDLPVQLAFKAIMQGQSVKQHTPTTQDMYDNLRC